MTRFHSCIRPFINTHPGFSVKNANQIIKSRTIKDKEMSPWRVPNSSPIIQKKKLKAKHKKNNFKKRFTIQTREILIKMMTVTAVNNVTSTAM
jgi:hypothetical protein